MSWPDSGPPLADEVARLARDVRRGLTARPRWLPPKYFYDAAGAELFDRITALPEYYLTRAEQAILAEVGAAIVRRLESREIVELGPGACHKVRPLLDAVDHGGAVRYVPFDVEGDALARALERLARDYRPSTSAPSSATSSTTSTGCHRRPAAASCSSSAA